MSHYNSTHFQPKINYLERMRFSNSENQYEKMVDNREPDDIEDDNFDILDEEIIPIEEDELDFE